MNPSVELTMSQEHEFVVGAIVGSFGIPVSGRVAPYFGSDMHTWAALISMELAASCVGYFAAECWPTAIHRLAFSVQC